MAAGIGVTVDTTGLTELIARFSALSVGLDAKVGEACLGAATDAKDTADTLTPVLTGFLKSRNQVRMAQSGGGMISAEYFNDAFYAPFVAFGHHTRSGNWVAPQDFVTPALYVGERSLGERLGMIPLDLFA